MLQRFTASYANTNPNFVFLNLPENKPEQGIVFSIASVIQNILTRSVCTRPSDLLKEKLGELGKQDLLYTIAKEKNIWHSRIKGNSRSFDNPASLFFHELLPKHLGEDWSFIPNLILPETPFEEIPGIAKDDFVDQQVDFFLPQAKLAIEIDGLQHKDQQLYDQSRDHELRLLGITTLRFTTADIRSQTPQFKNNISKKQSLNIFFSVLILAGIALLFYLK